MTLNRDDKKIARKMVREAIAAYSYDRLTSESETIMEQIEGFDEFRQAKVVALYWSLKDEVQTHAFIEKWCREKIILLPVVDGETMTFRRFSSTQELIAGEFDIPEPQQSKTPDKSDLFDHDNDAIDLIVVPGVAFDSCRRRLGRGRGFYDKFLADSSAYKIGVCLSAQLIDCVPSEAHDIVLDKIVSPSQIY